MSDCWEFLAAFVRSAPVVLLVTVLAGPVAAEQDQTGSVLERFSYDQVVKSPAAAEPGKLDANYHEYRMAQERHRIWALVTLAGAAVLAHGLLLWRLGTNNPSQIVIGTGFIYIVFGTIVLVTLSDNKDQLTASMGLMGAIVGYLFGRVQPARGQDEDKDRA